MGEGKRGISLDYLEELKQCCIYMHACICNIRHLFIVFRCNRNLAFGLTFFTSVEKPEQYVAIEK